ncbi:unnamed protein product, partial [marine sediment metagenome]
SLDGEAEISLGKTLGVRQASVKLTEGRLRIARAGLPVIAVDGKASLRHRVLDLTDVRIALGHGSLRGDIRLGIEGKNPPVSGTVRINRLELGELAPLLPLPSETTARGRVQGWVDISGRWPQPNLRGDISLAEGELSSPSLPRLAKIQARGRLSSQTLYVSMLKGEAGRTKVAGHGQIRLLPSPRLDLALEAKEQSIEELLGELGAPGWSGKAGLQAQLVAAPGSVTVDARLAWDEASWQGRPLPDGKGDVSCRVD